MLLANKCVTERLETEMEILFEHVVDFMAQKSPFKCWPALLLIKNELGIENILHIAELCIVLPLSYAEWERIFSFLWQIFLKWRQSLDNTTLDNILRLRCDNDFSTTRYGLAIGLFLHEDPDGAIRKRTRRLEGHVYPKKRAYWKKDDEQDKGVREVLDGLIPSDEEETVQDININDISDNDWFSDS